ncbi:hypothetical protein [Streptomyces sp. NPDC057381]
MTARPKGRVVAPVTRGFDELRVPSAFGGADRAAARRDDRTPRS